MIFMIFVKGSFHTLPRRFVGLNNASVFRLAILFNATGFPVLLTLSLARHCDWHRNFQFSTRILHDILEFFIIWINEVNTTQFSGIVELRFCDSPLMLFFAFRRVRHIFPNLGPQSVWSGGLLFSCQSPFTDHVYACSSFSSNTVNLVKPVHVPDNSRSSSTFQYRRYFSTALHPRMYLYTWPRRLE